MEIHAPERPINSFKDFGIHIAIVTIGILIALGLEGIREAVHEHNLVRDTRGNFRRELQTDHDELQDEVVRVAAGHRKLDALAQEAPALALQHPEQIVARLTEIHNPNYFLSTNTWQAALSTGALANMSAEEVAAYAWAAKGTATYTDLQDKALDAETRALAFWKAHPQPTRDQVAEGEERILLFAEAEQSLAFVAPQTQKSYDNALAAASR